MADDQRPRPIEAKRVYKIDKGVPIPEPEEKWTLVGQMRFLAKHGETGDSVFVQATQDQARNACSAVGPGWYTMRKQVDGTRVWKTAEPPEGWERAR